MLNSVKLINALTCIINGDIGGIYFPCNSGYECPYYVDDGDGLWECRRQDCLADVVTLLKEQEKQLKEWEKHVPFLAAHGILKGMDKYTIAEEAYKRGYVDGVLAEDKWIPVTVSLPEPDKPVLCTIYHGEFYTIAVGRVYKSVLSGKMVWMMDYPGNINTVIAWMPLPKAYRYRREEHE